MKPAEEPTLPYTPYHVSPTIHFACNLASVATPPLPEKHAPAPPPRPRGLVTLAGAPAARAPQHDTPWSSFRNLDPPALAADEYGVDNGPGPNDAIMLRAYAWGRSGSDWTRGGRWMVRFEDRFDPAGGVRSSALTTSLWSTRAARSSRARAAAPGARSTRSAKGSPSFPCAAPAGP
jgi:hypothetical protein